MACSVIQLRVQCHVFCDLVSLVEVIRVWWWWWRLGGGGVGEEVRGRDQDLGQTVGWLSHCAQLPLVSFGVLFPLIGERKSFTRAIHLRALSASVCEEWDGGAGGGGP